MCIKTGRCRGTLLVFMTLVHVVSASAMGQTADDRQAQARFGKTSPPDSVTTIHEYHPRSWYADCLARPSLTTSDGRYVLYLFEGLYRLHDVETGVDVGLAERIGWQEVSYPLMIPGGHKLNTYGRRKGESKNVDVVVDLDTGEETEFELPVAAFDARFTTSPDRTIVVGRYRNQAGLWLVDRKREAPLLLTPKRRFKALVVNHAADEVAYVVASDSGWQDLWLIDLDTGKERRLATGLDMTYQKSAMAYGPNDKEIFLSLVSADPAALEDKQNPDADRDLDIFAIDRATGALRPVVVAPGDDLVNGVGGDRLIWTNQTTSMRTGIVRIDGGEVRPLLGEQTSFPYWHPDGDRISVMFGGWHLADWALNWDLGVVPVHANGRPTGPMKPEVTGNHEDFALVWSPDGRWVAYHSHRSATPAASYGAADSTDDIWARAAGGGPEHKLTENVGFEVGKPNWSPDGTKIIFTATKRGPGSRPVVVEIDPDTAKAVSTYDFEVPGLEGQTVSASWSPTAPELAIVQARDAERSLWLVDEATKEKRRLAQFEALTESSGACFTPDGKHIVNAALVDGHHHLFRVSREEGATPVQLTHGEEEMYVPQVSPDGRLIATTVYHHTKSVRSKSLSE